MTDTTKPVADREKFNTWMLHFYRTTGRVPKEFEVWQAARSAQAQPVAFDVLSHEESILKAINNAIEMASADDDKSYWAHELNAVRRDLALLRASQQPVAATGDDEIGDDTLREFLQMIRDEHPEINCDEDEYIEMFRAAQRTAQAEGECK